MESGYGTWLDGVRGLGSKIGICKRGLGSYKVWRAVRPLNAKLLMAIIRMSFKDL